MSFLSAGRLPFATSNVRERARGWLSPVNLHWAGVGLLAVINLYLLLHMAFLWQEAQSQNADALAQQQVVLKTAEIAARPLQGLDTKLHLANQGADRFYHDRLPVSYSEVAGELGALAKHQGARLTRVQYAQSPVAGEAAGQLTEVKMDASLSGDYRAMVLFINGLERDRLFFYISGVTLTGQQSGTVNLRIRITTYLRSPGAAEQQPPVVADVESGAAPLAAPVAAPRAALAASTRSTR